MDSLIEYLASKGETVTVLRRPDKEIRNERAVDFEVELDGDLIGVEVTSASAHMANFVEVARFEEGVEKRISRYVEHGDLGEIAIRFSYLRRLRKREVPPLVQEVAAGIEARLSRGELPINVPVPVPVTDPLEQVEIFRLGDARNTVGRISSPIPAYFVDEEVLSFIDNLVDKKGTQGVAYEVLWILIHERTPLFSPRDLAGGLGVSRDALPGNWTRIFFLSGSEIEEVYSAA